MDQMKGSTALVGAIAAVALIVSGFVAVSGGKTGAPGPVGPQGPQGIPGIPGSPGADGKDGGTFGSASSPSVINDCMEVGGKQLCSWSQPMSDASTTCSRKVVATSTIPVGGVVAHFTNPRGNMNVEIGVGPQNTGVDATTTLLAHRETTTNLEPVTVVATSTMYSGAGELTDAIVAAGQFINVRVGSSSPNVEGRCSGVYWEI